MSNDAQVQALMKLVVRWASTGREADQIALESALRAAVERCPTGDLESAAQEMYERHGGKDWMREPKSEKWRAIANIGFKWAALSQQTRHPMDVEALYELQKVMADFGGDWPDLPGEQEVVRRAKMLSRLWKTDRAAQENSHE